MTYFPRAIRSIIGAEVFHGPVRDGKAWDHLAAARHKRVIAGCWVCNRCLVEQSSCWKKCRVLYCIGKYRIDSAYRIKPHGQLVSVSLTHYCASTPDLSTWWSSRPFRAVKLPGKSHLEASFALRCFQRLSLPCIATRRYDWRHNRYTRGTSTRSSY